MGIRSTLKRLIRLVHDPVHYRNVEKQPDANARHEQARADTDLQNIQNVG